MAIEEAKKTQARPKGKSSNAPVLAAKGVWDWLWHFFSNVKVALILILVLTGLTLVGTLLVQVPGDVASDPAQHAQWLGSIRGKFGVWTTFLDKLQLFNVFHSIWFKGSLYLLVINIAVCSLNRWKGIWTPISKPRLKFPDSYYTRGVNTATIRIDAKNVQSAADVFRKTSKKHGFRILEQAEGDSKVFFYADRNRFGQLGTYLFHLSIILLLIGVGVGGALGFRNNSFMVPEGSVRDVGYGTNLSVKLLTFTDEYYVEGPPKDFRSEVVVYAKGVEVKRGTIRVNQPLNVKGVRFHQSFFGTAASMQVQHTKGQVLFNDGLPMGWGIGTAPYERPMGMFSLPQQGETVYVIGPAKTREADPMIGSGQMRLEVYGPDQSRPLASSNVTQGQAITLNGLTFTFQREEAFTGLQVVKDPGGNIVWLASTLLVLGLIGVFYFPHRRVWAFCKTTATGTCEVAVRAVSRRDVTFNNEFKDFTKEVERAATQKSTPKDKGE